jgi:hypothetical protein
MLGSDLSSGFDSLREPWLAGPLERRVLVDVKRHLAARSVKGGTVCEIEPQIFGSADCSVPVCSSDQKAFGWQVPRWRRHVLELEEPDADGWLSQGFAEPKPSAAWLIDDGG